MPDGRKNRVFLLVGLAALVLLGVYLFVWDQQRDLAVATSPDGSWSVAVVGKKLLLGSGIEVHVEVRDRDGRPMPGAHVIGITSDWDQAKKGYGKVTCGPEEAVVLDRTIRRSDYFGR